MYGNKSSHGLLGGDMKEDAAARCGVTEVQRATALEALHSGMQHITDCILKEISRICAANDRLTGCQPCDAEAANKPGSPHCVMAALEMGLERLRTAHARLGIEADRLERAV